MKVQQIKVEDLIPYASNARTHDDAQVAQIAASIKEFSFLNPVLVDGENGILCGHGRVLAARKLGMKEVPTIDASHLTPAQRKAYIIADNKLALNAGWDLDILGIELTGLSDEGFDLSLIGFNDDELNDLFAGLPTEGSSEIKGKLSDRFGVAPFSVLNAREGWWQDRKRAWLALGIQSEIGRGGGMTWGDSEQVTEPGLNYYRNQNKARGGVKMAMHNDPMQRKAAYDG